MLVDGLMQVTPKLNYSFPKSCFDSVQLNGGFTTCFWIYVDKMGAEQHSTILHQWRNTSEYDFQVGFKNGGIYVEVRNQSEEIAKIFSEK